MRSHYCLHGCVISTLTIWALLINPINLQSAFSIRLAPFDINFYSLFMPDLMHEFELGVWKAVFIHLVRVLYALGGEKIQQMNDR